MVCLNTTYTLLAGGFGKLITTLSFNPLSPNVTVLSTADAGNAPSWVALHPTLADVAYSVNEDTGGSLATFSIADTGALSKVADVSTGGNGPTFTVVLNDGSEIIASNFGDGTSAFVPLSSDGSFNGTAQVIKYDAPVSNPHQSILYKDEVLVPDLGADRVWRLTKDSTGTWGVRDFQSFPTGSGPRHGVVINDNLYIVAEKANQLIQQTIPTLGSGSSARMVTSLSVTPSDLTDTSSYAAAECLTSTAAPDGIIYVTNRNTDSTPDPRGDSIAIFDASNPAQLKFVKQVFTGVTNLRGAALFGRTDEYLIVGGNTESGGLAVFSRSQDGKDLQLISRNTQIGPTTSFVWI